MRIMSERITEFRRAIDYLPESAILVLQDVEWEEYESLLENLEDRPGVRLTYDQGRLEIVTTSRKHEKHKTFISGLVRILSDELHLTVEASASTTWMQERLAMGAEADECFHIANAALVIGKDELDLDVDPGPDLAVEIDVSNQSLSKLPIYAAFRVPEIWRYIAKRKTLVIYELRGDSYIAIEASRSFPMLTPAVLVEFLERSASEGQTRALNAFREWLRITGPMRS